MQYRTKVTLRFEPDDSSQSDGPVTLFRLEKHTTRQKRQDRHGAKWYDDSSTRDYHVREVVTAGMTRRDVEALIADGLDWLTYAGEAGL